MNNKLFTRLLPITVLTLVSSTLMVLWKLPVYEVGEVFLIRFGLLIAALILSFILLSVNTMSKLSKKYPKKEYLSKMFLGFGIELLIYLFVLSGLVKYSLLEMGGYFFLYLTILIILSMVNKISRLTYLAEEYKENPGENWKSLITEAERENNYAWFQKLLITIILLSPLAFFINIQLGIFAGLLILGLLLSEYFEKIIK